MDDISTGASNDIERATSIARDMVSKYGMSEKLGTVAYGTEGEVFIGRDYEKSKSYSEKVAATIDDEVKILIDKAYGHCKQILSDNSDKLNAVVEFLLEHENMTGSQFADCMEGRAIDAEDQTSMFERISEE